MRGLILAALLAAPLGACANLRMAAESPECRHVLSPEGQALSFCESPTGLIVAQDSEPPDPSADAKLIDDPKFLASMMDQLPKSSAGASKVRADKDKTCERTPPGYITLSSSDYLALVQARGDVSRPEASAPPSLRVRSGRSPAPLD
jgi:hypothetical protein